MFEVDSRRLIDDIERTVQKASEKSPLDYLDQAKQLRLESEIKMRNIIQAKQEELLGVKHTCWGYHSILILSFFLLLFMRMNQNFKTNQKSCNSKKLQLSKTIKP